ncbi:hypothetical protein A9D36_06135 [Bacillus subtilis]|nr:hypothetical protein A9D36_06135 [Bacillus subtilis]
MYEPARNAYQYRKDEQEAKTERLKKRQLEKQKRLQIALSETRMECLVPTLLTSRKWTEIMTTIPVYDNKDLCDFFYFTTI